MSDIAAIGTMIAALMAAFVSLLTFLRQGRTDAKVEEIKKHTNGLVAALVTSEKKASRAQGVVEGESHTAKPTKKRGT